MIKPDLNVVEVETIVRALRSEARVVSSVASILSDFPSATARGHLSAKRLLVLAEKLEQWPSEDTQVVAPPGVLPEGHP